MYSKISVKFLTQLLFCLCFIPCVGNTIRADNIVSSQVTIDTTTFFNFLCAQEDIHLTIHTDTRSLWNKKSDKYSQAKLSFEFAGIESLVLEGELRTRGNARKAICTNPPLKIRFKKSDLKDLGFQAFKTIKLVNPCNYNDAGLDYLQVELAIYKAYSLLTEKSFATKEITITYIDENDKKKEMESMAFIIEHDDEMAVRNKGEIYSAGVIPERIYDRFSILTYSLFQYMIGNTDWSCVKLHNCKAVKSNSNQLIFPVAYDFDYAGIVDASYAVPAEQLNLDNVRERLYRGPCFTEDEFRIISQYFLDRKEAILRIFNLEEIAASRNKSCQKYLNDFFDLLEDDKASKNTFINCE